MPFQRSSFALVLLASLLSCFTSVVAEPAEKKNWSFTSIPDFLNFDIEYPQKGWEDALGFILTSVKKEDPAFVMVAGDLVMDHWGPTKKDVNRWADRYYPPWTQRFANHDLKVYAALGDHGIGDNPWRGSKADLVPTYKEAPFCRHLRMPLNGPDHMKGTTFWKTIVKYDVDLYLCGEVHAVTCKQKDGILQIAHGGLLGRTNRPNYLVVTVRPDRLDLTPKEIDLVNGRGRLWQRKKARGPGTPSPKPGRSRVSPRSGPPPSAWVAKNHSRTSPASSTKETTRSKTRERTSPEDLSHTFKSSRLFIVRLFIVERFALPDCP